MLEIEENHEFNEILGNTNFDELDITYSLMSEQLDVSEELLGIAFGSCGRYHWHDGDGTP